MKNVILNKIMESRNGHCCHVLEVSTIYELENVIECILSEFEGEKIESFIDFFNSITVYYLNDSELTELENEANEEEVYNFNFEESIKQNF